MSSSLSLTTSMTFWSTNFSTVLTESFVSVIFPGQLLRVGLCHTYTCLAEIKKSDRRTCSHDSHILKMYRESYKRNTLIKKQPDYLLRVQDQPIGNRFHAVAGAGKRTGPPAPVSLDSNEILSPNIRYFVTFWKTLGK